MLLTGRDVATWNVLGAARSFGYVLTVMNAGADFEGGNADKAEVIERLKRWYSMGPIRVADFNGDGGVDNQDLYDFRAAYAQYRDDAPAPGPDRPFTVYATCDLNQDGKVTIDDWNMFHDAWDAAPSYPDGLGPVVDYFDANV